MTRQIFTFYAVRANWNSAKNMLQQNWNSSHGTRFHEWKLGGIRVTYKNVRNPDKLGFIWSKLGVYHIDRLWNYNSITERGKKTQASTFKIWFELHCLITVYTDEKKSRESKHIESGLPGWGEWHFLPWTCDAKQDPSWSHQIWDHGLVALSKLYFSEGIHRRLVPGWSKSHQRPEIHSLTYAFL